MDEPAAAASVAVMVTVVVVMVVALAVETARDALVGMQHRRNCFSPPLDAARVITVSRKIKKVIARKSKITESNCAWKWNPRLLLSTLEIVLRYRKTKRKKDAAHEQS